MDPLGKYQVPNAVDVEIVGERPVFVTAILMQASKEEAFGKPFLVGAIYRDQLGRFKDGTWMHTSFIAKELAPNLFLTRDNDVYRVDTWKFEPVQRDTGDENDYAISA